MCEKHKLNESAYQVHVQREAIEKNHGDNERIRFCNSPCACSHYKNLNRSNKNTQVSEGCCTTGSTKDHHR